MFLLKDSLEFFNKRCAKVAFFDEWCLYNHIYTFRVPKKHKYTVGEILDILEPYIPLRLTEDSFDYFLEAVITAEELDAIDPKFCHKAKLDFVLSLKEIKNRDQWEQAVAVCEAIRSLKEELLAVY